jgi:GT2 family glycosyltransferase
MGDQQKKELKLSVIIPTYYRYNCLAIVLDLLKKQTVKPFEVIAVDQTPLDERPRGFYEEFKSLPLKVLNLKKPSYSHARNEGARFSSGNILLFIDDDVEFEKNFIEQHFRIITEENVDVVVGASYGALKLDKYNDDRPFRLLDPLSLLLKARHGKWNGMVFGIIGFNTTVKREIFLKVGGFDEIIPRMEDMELGYRLYKSGAKMFRSHYPVVNHKRWQKGGSHKRQKDLSHVRMISKFYFYKKHFPGWVTIQLLLREILNALAFRKLINGHFSLRYLVNPFRPFIQLWKLSKAWRESERLLKAYTSKNI